MTETQEQDDNKIFKLIKTKELNVDLVEKFKSDESYRLYD